MKIAGDRSGPAFPNNGNDGMSLLEYYAAHAGITWEQATAHAYSVFDDIPPTPGQIIRARVFLSLLYAETMVKELQGNG